MTRPDSILDGLNEAQREAAAITTGPVLILAGAGTGKTRVISHRVAFAVASGVVRPSDVLLVTFTEKAAKEMVERVGRLGLPLVTARTFHSAALAQLRHFWPARHDGQALPEILSDKYRLVAPLARRLPGGYQWTPARDLIDEIEWAMSRRIAPERYEAEAGVRTPPIPVELFVRVFRDYTGAKRRQGLIDFDDMLTLTVELLESDEDAARQVRERYAWFSVDEYQDTNPLQQRLLDLWLGDRRDLCVVGDEDQTIYTFAGATPEYLTGFGRRFPDARAVRLVENYRSTPQVLALANRLIASTGRTKGLTATRGPGPEPTLRGYREGEEELAAIVGRVRVLLAEGVAAREVAVLVRLNAQLAPIEAAFTRAGLPYQVRGQRFFERREVRAAIEALGRLPAGLAGPDLVARVRSLWAQRLGFSEEPQTGGSEARERQSALATLLSVVEEAAGVGQGTGGPADSVAVLAELERRAAAERSGSAEGVELLTYHRAKGLEWDAVFLPSLEEGLLPVGQALDDDAALAEERRLLYVGLTRARVHLWLSWAETRATPQGKLQRRQPSRFLDDLAARPVRGRPGAGGSARAPTRSLERDRSRARDAHGSLPEGSMALLAALRAWRSERARADQVPAYVVAHDSMLAEIAERRPRTLAELSRIPGIGPAKLEKYGPEVIGLVDGAAHAEA